MGTEIVLAAKQVAASLGKMITKASLSPRTTTAEKCPECGGDGYVVVETYGRRWAYECECLLQRRVFGQIPPHYENASLVDFLDEIVRDIVGWRSHPQQGLMIFGNPGRGKTYLAAAIVRSLILIRCEALFRRAFSFFAEMRHALTAGEEELIFAKYVAAQYLFIDDFNADCSDFERRFLLELIDRRIDYMRPTCFTTNCTLKQIGASLDGRIASRLGEFRWIHLDGPDLRRFPKLQKQMVIEITEEKRKIYEESKSEALRRFGQKAG